MAKQKAVTVIEKNAGKKIDFEQEGTRLIFGDDELMLNVAKYQKPWPVHIDICEDAAGNLFMGTAVGLYYVAELDIPQIEYEEQEPVENEGEGVQAQATQQPIPLDMSDVILTLWSIEARTPVTE